MLDQALRNAMSQVPNCIAVGAVDLNSGTLLAIEAEQERSQEMLNIMTATITELFEAPLLQAFSEIYAGNGEEGSTGNPRPFTELLLMNAHHNYLLLRGRKRQNLAVAVITRKDTSAGLLMMKAMALMPDIENAL
jgi:hypothetical protein